MKQQLSYLQGQTDLADAKQGVELEKLNQERERLKAEAAAQNARVQNELDAQRTKMQGEAEGAARAAQGYTWQEQQNAEVSKISAEHPQTQQPVEQLFSGQTYVNPLPFRSSSDVNKQAPVRTSFDSGMGVDIGATTGVAGYTGDIGPATDELPIQSSKEKKPIGERLEELKGYLDKGFITKEIHDKRVMEILQEV